MEEQKKEFIEWVKAHKKELIIVGISISSIIAIIVVVKNKDSIVGLWKSLHNNIDKTPTESVANSYRAADNIPVIETVSESQIIQFPEGRTIQYSFDVNPHIRNLPDGFHASAEKSATAVKNGYKLRPNQTWVAQHTKGVFR